MGHIKRLILQHYCAIYRHVTKTAEYDVDGINNSKVIEFHSAKFKCRARICIMGEKGVVLPIKEKILLFPFEFYS